MATQKQEIPMDDAELDALMAELADEVAGAVDAPAATVAAAPAPEPEPTPEPTPEPAPEPVKQPEPTPAPAAVTPDEDLESLVAEIEASHKPADEPKPDPAQLAKVKAQAEAEARAKQEKADALLKAKATPVSAPKPESAPAPAKPELKVVEPAPVAVAAPAAAPNPPARKPAPALQFYIDPEKLKEELALSDTNLDTAQMQQAALSYYYSSQASMAEAQAKRMKVRLEHAENTAYLKYRKAILDAGEKPTERQLEAIVRTDPAYIQAKNAHIEAEFIADTNRSAAFAMKERRDMVIQMGADRREGQKGQARTMAQDDMHREMKARALAASGN